jgi:hypothetical protein
MSAHNILHDLYKAPMAISDVASGKTLVIDRDLAVVPMTSAGAETRILAAPTKAGLEVMLECVTYVGDIVVTVKDTAAATTYTLTFGAAGYWVKLLSVQTSTTNYKWQVVQAYGATGVTSSLGGAASVTTLNATSYIVGVGYAEIDGATSVGIKLAATATGGYLITVTNTAQTVGTVTLTIPDFANANDTFAFVTLAQTLANKTLTAPTVNLGKHVVDNTGVTASGSTVADATPVAAKDFCKVIGVTGQTGYGVKLLTGVAGQCIFVWESAGFNCKLYAASGGNVGGGADAAITLTASHVYRCECVAADTWVVTDLGARKTS